jgi:diphosphomevalonate decarboxylase
MSAVKNWRNGGGSNEGLPVYFTIDAGPNVHLLCEGKDEARLLTMVRTLDGIEEIILNKPAEGARIISEHLF